MIGEDEMVELSALPFCCLMFLEWKLGSITVGADLKCRLYHEIHEFDRLKNEVNKCYV